MQTTTDSSLAPPGKHLLSVFAQYYPARAGQMKLAAAVAREPAADRAALTVLIGDLGPWLAAEYLAEHGRKAPRAGNAAG